MMASITEIKELLAANNIANNAALINQIEDRFKLKFAETDEKIRNLEAMILKKDQKIDSLQTDLELFKRKKYLILQNTRKRTLRH